jgi:pimeloyl-ACP methyl ester carboxylesterase
VAPPIRFFRGTLDQRIAYSVLGRGPLLVFPAWWVSHLERDWDDPGFRDLFERLAEHRAVVRYDRPGVGLSERREGHVDSIDDELANLEALVRELGAERIALLGGSCGAPPAIAYAAKHPDRTTHLILYGGYASGPKLAPKDVRAAVSGIVRAHWGLGSKTLTELFAPDASADERDRIAAMQRHTTSAERAAALLDLIYTMDVEALLPTVRVPTLVMHRKGDRAMTIDHGRALAAGITGATFLPLDGATHFPWLGDRAAVADATIAFLGGRVAHVESIENAFVRAGDVWSVAFGGKRAHVKHARGVADIATLIAANGEEVAAGDLIGGVKGRTKDVVLDAKARAALRTRLAALDERIASAEAAGNVRVAERAGEEKAKLMSELRAATGLGGRPRALDDAGERARKAVTSRIRDAIDKLRAPLPELGKHLDASITTGAFCRYAPASPIVWRT